MNLLLIKKDINNIKSTNDKYKKVKEKILIFIKKIKEIFSLNSNVVLNLKKKNKLQISFEMNITI